jgi:hypothetical protein
VKLTELLVEDGYPTVEHQGSRGQLRYGSRDVAEAARVVEPVAADQADAVAVLVDEDAPAAS